MSIKLGFKKDLEYMLRYQKDDIKTIGCMSLKNMLDTGNFVEDFKKYKSTDDVLNRFRTALEIKKFSDKDINDSIRTVRSLLETLKKLKVIQNDNNTDGLKFNKERMYKALNCGKFFDAERITVFTKVLQQMSARSKNVDTAVVGTGNENSVFTENIAVMGTENENSVFTENAAVMGREQYTLKGVHEKTVSYRKYDILIILVVIFIIILLRN